MINDQCFIYKFKPSCLKTQYIFLLITLNLKEFILSTRILNIVVLRIKKLYTTINTQLEESAVIYS